MHIIGWVVNNIARLCTYDHLRKREKNSYSNLIVAFDPNFETWNDNMHKSRLLTSSKKIMIEFNGRICLGSWKSMQ